MNNKRGISAIVATVLIILITVAAVTIIWAAIIPMINNQLDKGTVCLDAVSQVTIEDEGYTCLGDYDDTSKNFTISLQIGHGAKDFSLAGVQVLISEAGNTKTIVVDEGLPGPNEKNVTSIQYTNTTIAGPEKIEIAPIVGVGNTQEICDVSASKVLTAC